MTGYPARMTRYSWRLLRAGRFRLDGGSMFGLVPRVVWSRSVTPDDRGRIEVQHNCLLLERSGPGPGPKLILIETGSGDKLDAKSRDIFALENRSIVDALHEADCRPEDIGAVVVSHLHFDHAGGLTRLARPGEKPDAIAQGSSGQEHGVRLTFPSAAIYAQSREWDDALANRSVMTRTYFRDHLEPIRDRLEPVDSPPPFAPGAIVERDETPGVPLAARETEIAGGAGISVFLVPGHTWGQQAITFTDVHGRVVVFTPDVMPTVNHIGAAYSLGYDVEPYTSMVSRRWFLDEAARGNWLLVLDHEPGNPCQRVRPNGKGWFELVGEEAGG